MVAFLFIHTSIKDMIFLADGQWRWRTFLNRPLFAARHSLLTAFFIQDDTLFLKIL